MYRRWGTTNIDEYDVFSMSHFAYFMNMVIYVDEKGGAEDLFSMRQSFKLKQIIRYR